MMALTACASSVLSARMAAASSPGGRVPRRPASRAANSPRQLPNSLARDEEPSSPRSASALDCAPPVPPAPRSDRNRSYWAEPVPGREDRRRPPIHPGPGGSSRPGSACNGWLGNRWLRTTRQGDAVCACVLLQGFDLKGLLPLLFLPSSAHRERSLRGLRQRARYSALSARVVKGMRRLA